MAHEVTYRLRAKNRYDQQDIIVHISDTDSPVGTPVFTELTLASLEYETANSDDDPFGMIRASKLSFSFVPTQTYGLSTFKSGVDRRFLVELYLANTGINIFRGFLLTEETKEDLLPKSVNGEWAEFFIELTAIDGLSTLKEIPLTIADTTPRGWFTPMEYLAAALKLTGHELFINVVDSITNSLDPEIEGNWWNTTYLWSKTFEGESTKDGFISIDCYSALEILLKGRFLFQYGGEWWVIRTDEMIGGEYSIFLYSDEGIYLTAFTNTYEKQIGKTQAIKFLDKNAFVFPSRPHKYDLQDYRFEMPAEIPDNKDFVRGDQLSFASLIGKYEIDDWTLLRTPNLSPTTDAYIRREFADVNQTYELAKSVVIEADANWHYLHSNELYMMEKDKCVVSFDRKLTADHSGSGTTTELLGQLRLVGEDGSFWTCCGLSGFGYQVGEWVLSSAGFLTNAQYMGLKFQPNVTNETEWQSVSLETYPLPIGGSLYILLYQSSIYGTTDDTYFSNLNFEYIPYILKDYSKFTGQYHKVFQDDSLKANREEEIKLSDSPKRMFKGALHRAGGGGYILTTTTSFYDYRLGLSGGLGVDTFGKYLAFDFFNNNFDFLNKVQSSFVGLNAASNPSDIPGMLHQYTIDFSTNDDHTADRVFQLISFKMDMITCKWEGVLCPTNNTVLGHPTTWDHEFRYRSE